MSRSDLSKKIDQGIKKAIAAALLRHKKLGQSIVVSQNGKIVIIPPEKIKIPAEKKKKSRKKS